MITTDVLCLFVSVLRFQRTGTEFGGRGGGAEVEEEEEEEEEEEDYTESDGNEQQVQLMG
jgi:hypothetical protein